jgi:glycosyltransferase involved in cell wall biosynthesis
MRILIVAPVPPDPDGAGAIPIVLHAEAVGLAAGNDVTLVTAVGAEPGEAEAVGALETEGFDVRFADRRPPSGSPRRWARRLRMVASWLRGRPWRSVWFADPGVQAIIDGLAPAGFEVALVEDSAMAGYRLPEGATSILTEHEVLRPRPLDRRPGPPSRWASWAFRELDWRRRTRHQEEAWGRFQRVITFTRRDAEQIAERVPRAASRVRVSPFGVEMPAPAGRPGAVPGPVLFVGNFTHQPNRDAARWLATEIAPAVRASRPEAAFRLLGSSPPPSVVALAGPGVDVIADPRSVESEVAEAAVVVAPVRTGGGMRMKVLQALAAGRAVVTTSRGTEGFDCFAESPPLVVADDAASFADAIAALLADDERRAELGAAAREFAERHYSPSAWAARLESIFAEARHDG